MQSSTNPQTCDDATSLLCSVHQLLKAAKRYGLTHEALLGTDNDARRLRVVRLLVLQAQAHVALGNPARAEQLLAGPAWELLPRLPANEWAVVAMERARCARQRQQWEVAERWTRAAVHDYRAGRRVPGNHRLWARALRELGRVEEAMEVVRRGIVYEAPWNTKNKHENQALYLQLAIEVGERTEARRKEEAFLAVWGPLLAVVQDKMLDNDAPKSWESIKEKDWDMLGDDDGSDDDSLPGLGEEETALKVQALTRAVLETAGEESEHPGGAWAEGPQSAVVVSDVGMGKEEECHKEYVDIKLTRGALKDVKALDTELRKSVVRKLDDLAFGRGGMTTRKALVGCRNVRIFETYVENQGAGRRILWTELDDSSICIWYVAKHKDVSKMMKMIDEADERSERRLTSAAVLLSGTSEMKVDAQQKTIGTDRIFLDPFSDTPLKVYDIPREEITKLESPKWTPRLHLTKQECEIVQTEGTVLLLGRSGPGYVF